MLSEATSGSATTMLLCGVDISSKPAKKETPEKYNSGVEGKTKIQELAVGGARSSV